jgi:hypothetical protein
MNKFYQLQFQIGWIGNGTWTVERDFETREAALQAMKEVEHEADKVGAPIEYRIVAVYCQCVPTGDGWSLCRKHSDWDRQSGRSVTGI